MGSFSSVEFCAFPGGGKPHPAVSGLFVYGTLMFPEVFQEVAGIGQPAPQMATLFGFRRFRVSGQCYPGAVSEAGAAITGIVCGPLPEYVLRRLDVFEGAEYRRVQVSVHLAGGDDIAVWFYETRLVAGCVASTEDWHPEAFRESAIRQFTGRDRSG